MMLGDDELIAPLRLFPHIFQTWKARGKDGQAVVLRLISYYGMDKNLPERVLEPIMALPVISGFVPWLNWNWQLIDDHKELIVRRPFYPERLIDRFSSDADHPPSPDLLTIFTQLAHTFDMLEAHYPDLDLDLSPGNLLVDGDQPVLVDCGLSWCIHGNDMDNRNPFSSHVDPERRVPLSASYPSMWQIFAATKSAHNFKIKRTDAQYALGALYIYLRTRFLVFEDPANPFPVAAENAAPKDTFMPRIQWYMTLHDTIQAYEEHGTLKLAMLTNPAEHAVLSRALARDPASRYPSCAAFVEALKPLAEKP